MPLKYSGGLAGIARISGLSPPYLSTQASSQYNDLMSSREQVQKYQGLFKPQLETRITSLLLHGMVKASYKISRDSRSENMDFCSLWDEWQHHEAEEKVYRIGGVITVEGYFFSF